VLYLTQSRLMLESERSVQDRARSDEEIAKRVCSQLLADAPRYSLWHARHEAHMNDVANARRRERQILTLRALSIEQIHRTALVRYLRDHQVKGTARDQTLREFYGVVDPRESAILEHRNYLLAASTQFCTADILELIGDTHGVELVRRYEFAYLQYFGMFCEQARARQNKKTYMLEALLPEARGAAERLRARIMDNKRVAPQPLSALKGYLADRRGDERRAAERRRDDSLGASRRGTDRRRSESLDPRPQIQLLRPRGPRLSV
jgi:hypothetical protein